MAITFDAANKIIQLDTFSVSASEIWSRWIDWVVLSDNAKYLPAFSQLGGVAPVALYIYLENSWKVRPQEANGITSITGNLLVQGGGSPIAATLGTFQVLVNLEAPIAAQAIEVNTGAASTELTNNVAAIKVKTDKISFSTDSGGNENLQSNVRSVNDVELAGDGDTTPMGSS